MEQRDGCGIDSGFSSAIQMLTPVTVSLVGISNTKKNFFPQKSERRFMDTPSTGSLHKTQHGQRVVMDKRILTVS